MTINILCTKHTKEIEQQIICDRLYKGFNDETLFCELLKEEFGLEKEELTCI